MDNKEKSPHILNASSNLLGLCFIVLTSLKILNLTGKTLIDEITSVALIMFMASSVLSFLSLRSKTNAGERYENIADIIFLTGLSLLFITTLLISFDIIK